MKRNGKKSRKIRKLILACTLSAVVLIVSTYTWFIGLQTINVNPFQIEIATTEGLFLSMDGENWVYNLDVASATKYADNTNTFAENGLIPMSSVGDLDSSVSRMKLFEKGSYTTSPGGYRLMASRVNNYTKTTVGDVTTVSQGEGYVAFDLFIKNLSGAEYYAVNDPLNEEAIYLTTDSSVSVVSTGDSDPQLKTGIENSIRVGFTQIGRVKATTTDADVITDMTCTDDSANSVTGICRNAQIWEPNETKHVQNALTWYTQSCSERKNVTAAEGGTAITPDKITEKSSYDLTKECKAIPTGIGATTYAISRAIDYTDGVDVYDGTELNKYTANTKSYSDYIKRYNSITAEGAEAIAAARAVEDAKYKLVNFDYFTDAEKNTAGATRPTFMTLAPNSITKVRVYIWLEGQDIDNYNFAQLGKTIKVNFGFTKERYTANDIPNYDGPALVTSNNADITTGNQAS